MGLSVVATAKNTTEIAKKVTVLASNVDTVNNTQGLTKVATAKNTAEIARATTALTSDYNSSN